MNQLLAYLLIANGAGAQELAMPLSKSWLESKAEARRVPAVGSPLRAAMLAEVHQALTNTSLELQYGGRLDLLAIELGDPQMLQTYAGTNFTNRYGGVTRDSLRMLERTTKPSVIQAVSIYLDRAEPIKDIFAAEQVWLRPSVAATHIMRHVLRQSDSFNQETRQWAQAELNRPLFEERAREQMRTFWAENAQHFAAKDYQAVRPPGTQLGQSATPQPAVNKSNSAPTLPAVARPPAKRVRSGTDTNSTITVPALAVTPAPTTAPFAARWPWLLLAAGTGGGWLWWRSRH